MDSVKGPATRFQTIRTQTILVSFVPLAFLLVLLALALLLQDRIVRTAAWSQQSEVAITQAAAVGKALGNVNSAVVQYSTKRDAASVKAYEAARKQLEIEYAKLDTLVAGDPAQLARAERIRSASNAGVGIIAEYLHDLQQNQPARARALINSSHTRRVIADIGNAYSSFTDAQRAKMIVRFNQVRRQVQSVGLALILICVAGILVALFVSARFGLNIAQRLRQLAENARRLAAGEPTEPIRGGDEIAALDGVYHEMTTRIQREHHVASTLQRVLLPQEMPKIPGLRIDTAYVPAAKGAEVGGDWYDVFALSDRRICISVGDVGGHGLRAASIMGTARMAIRTAARIESDPAQILRHVNRVLCADEPNVVVTAFVATLDLTDGSIAYAVAGHPMPVRVRPSGKTDFLAGEGLVLGIDPRTQYHRFEDRVEEGSGLVFYTDGIVEVEREYFQGLSNFVDAVRAEHRHPSENIAEAIQRRVLARKKPIDDCALLFLGVTALGNAATAPLHRTWSIDAREESAMRRVKRALLWHLGEVTTPESDLSAVELIVGELVGNVARHAPGEAEITLAYDDGAATLHVCDTGKPFQPSFNGTPDLFSESGRGLFIVRAVSRDIKIERTQTGNRVSVVLPVSLH